MEFHDGRKRRTVVESEQGICKDDRIDAFIRMDSPRKFNNSLCTMPLSPSECKNSIH